MRCRQRRRYARRLTHVQAKIRKFAMWKKMYMEGIAEEVRLMFPEASKITVQLAFGRHVVKIYPRAM